MDKELDLNMVKNVSEKAVLVAVDTGEYDALKSMEELRELSFSAGAQVVATVIQKRSSADVATCVGEGKLSEIKTIIDFENADIVIFDTELSGSQLKNIEKALDIKVIDRTMLILDIFALRARTSEGRLQVELAQQKYLLPRLVGMGNSLSRQGGGIGTRGPGESMLESDRRHIREKIANISDRLKAAEKTRELLKKKRKKDEVLTVAILGYTNVGKSTLLNYLTNAGVLCEDMLFATLDPTARSLKLPDGRNVMLIDTVGLVSRLPHMLVEAFHSTLQEAADADLILNVCDISSPDANIQ
ncbi:MAG: GTPase HflX, partial [Oscillospiraceae bacterium]